MKKATSNETIEWRFNALSSPHFIFGLWQAGIKSVETHTARVMGNQLNTVFTQIEVVLNSRPPFPVSTDINDL